MTEDNRDRHAPEHSMQDAAGGMEGGMASGTAGGPGEEELQNGALTRTPETDAPEKAKESAVAQHQEAMGDMGQGSFEQSQDRGAADRGRS
jgi:hypothetical protein